MGIYRCHHCKHIQEHIYHRSLKNLGQCAKCKHDVHVHDTVYFVEQIINRYTAAMREIESLKNQLDDTETSDEQADNQTLTKLSIHDTNQLATQKQHQPLMNWFEKKQITVKFDYAAVDMSGFYDEAAEKIGNHHTLFKDILSKIAWGYRKNVLNLNVDLKKYSQKEQQQLNHLCRELYSHTFFSIYNYKKQDKKLFVKLQTATPIRQFFTGTWLEWFALNKVLQAVQAKNTRFSVARGAEIHFVNGDLHELDVLLYTPSSGMPIVIECKSGEYRKDLDKYLNLRKRLNIPAQNYILLVLDIDDAQAKSLSSMYDLTFATLNTISECVQKVI